MINYFVPILLLLFGAAVLVIAIVMFVLNWKKDQTEHDAEQQISMLISRVALMQVELTKKEDIIEEQKRRIIFYTEQLRDVESRVRDLELILFGRDMDKRKEEPEDHSDMYPELLIVGTDCYIQRQDEIAVSKSGISYRRLFDATQDEFEAELRRARQQKAPYKYVMLSGHGNKNGWKMSDGLLLDGYWMNQNLSDTEIVYLNGCQSVGMGDDLVSIVDCVISMAEDVPTKTAQSFASMFWSGIHTGKTPDVAFTEALTVEPSIRPYVSIRY